MTAAADVGTLTPAGVLRALAAALERDPERWPGRDQYQAGADVDGYRDAGRLYVLPAAWQAITGRPGAAVLSVLHDRGDLAVPDGWRRKGEWAAPAPSWAGKARTYAVSLAAIAAPAPDPPPASVDSGSKTGPARAGSLPAGWSSTAPALAPGPAAAPAEQCPDCGADAERTPQGTLTDCPACGLVLTAGCRERIGKQEAAAARSAPAAVAVPGMAEQWHAAARAERAARLRAEHARLYRAWAAVLAPAPAHLAAACADACDGLRAAADLAGRAEPDELAAFHAGIGRPLVEWARELLDAIRAGRADYDDGQDDDDYEDDDDGGQDDDSDDDADTVTALPALPAAAPACGHCAARPAAARVDTADPAHRYAIGGRLPADVCERCGEAVASAAARLTYVRLVILADYGTGRHVTAPEPPPPPDVYRVREAAPLTRPAPLPAPPPAPRPAVPPAAAAWFARPPAPRCEIRGAHPVRVGVLGNRPPRAAVTVTDGQRAISACAGRCAERARAILAAESPRRPVAVEAIT